jgi:hypothetical protein
MMKLKIEVFLVSSWLYILLSFIARIHKVILCSYETLTANIFDTSSSS